MATAKTRKAQFLKDNLNPSETYAGIILGTKPDEPDHHLILLSGEPEPLNWEAAKKWAAAQGGELPTRREQSLLFANCKDHFQGAWYWSSEPHAAYSGFAWMQNFHLGSQGSNHKDYDYRARAVRRLVI